MNARNLLNRLLVGMFVVLCAAQRPARADCSPPGITDGPLEVTKGAIDFDVWYKSDDCAGTGDTITAADAQNCLNAISNSYDLYGGFGFRTPYGSTLPDFAYYIHNITGFGVTHSGCVEIDSVSFRCDATDAPIRKTTHHEMFHTIQKNHLCDVSSCGNSIGGTFGTWVSEGTARCMDDRLYADLDAATFGGSFGQECGNTMATPTTSLLSRSYDACLFWSYCCERFGSTLTEPQRGVDFMLAFWEKISANGSTDAVTALRDTLSDFKADSLDIPFRDYAIAVYTHGLNLTGIANSSLYKFVDEQQNGDPSYGTVPVTAVVFPTSAAVNVSAYASKYYQATVTPGTSCQAVGFHATSDNQAGWAVVGINSTNQVKVLSSGSGTEYGRTIIVTNTNNITKFAAIVVGYDEAINVDYDFAKGIPGISIIRPTSVKQVFPGPAGTPGRFLARVYVTGPVELEPDGVGTRSILGLEAADFTVTVGAVAATVLSAAYVGGEYWLVCQAPLQAADGAYNLTVQLCDNVSTTSNSSVLYGAITINHVITVDRSGSMAEPAANPKLNAAKVAGKLYVDAVSDNDRVGVIRFNGNGINCDDDADLLEALDLGSALNQRTDCKNDIEALSASGKTSIGDGLWKSQDQLDLFPAGTDLHQIVLLSDGMENEARYWDTAAGCGAPDTARARIEPGDTVINAIAFGPESDQDLMQDTSTRTDGDFSYVDVTAGAASSSLSAETPTPAAPPAPSSMNNQLADAYMDALQRARGLERIFFTSGALAATTPLDVIIPVTEPNSITNATFFFNVSDPAANLTVQLFDPANNLVNAATAKIYTTTAHAVYHILTPPPFLANGNWRARLTAASNIDFIAGLLGKERLGVQMILKVAQVHAGPNDGQSSNGKFEQGVPVTLLAILTDASGPVRGALVEITINKPVGLGCGAVRLFDDGNHGDGRVDDGVYGLIFTQTWLASRGGVNNDFTGHGAGTRGSYQLRAKAAGNNNAGQHFERYGNTSFNVYLTTHDQDQDGLPDAWERYYGTNALTPDAMSDPDGDGLTNLAELQQGTDPLNADTDGGGEADGSEVMGGRCAAGGGSPDPSQDDLLPAPVDVEAVMKVGDEGREAIQHHKILLRFPWNPSYQGMRIYRAIGAPVNLTLYQTLAPGQAAGGNYYDAGVMVNALYYYRFQAVGAGGASTRFSKIVSGMARPRLPDFDLDGDVDEEDFNLLWGCSSGSDVPTTLSCDEVDLDGDNDVDLNDFGLWQRCVSGEGVPFNQACLN